MKRTALLAVLALLASPAWSQAAKAPAEKSQAVKAPAEKPQAASQAKPAVASADRKSRRNEDARHCLEKSSNTEIIKCAEAYL